MGCDSAIESDAAATGIANNHRRSRMSRNSEASTIGTSSCRAAVAGSARESYAPPSPGARPVIATWPASTATPPQTELKSARPASNTMTNATGTRIADSLRTTSVGSTPASFETSARKPCQSGNA